MPGGAPISDKNTLGLDDSLDLIELVEELQGAFGVELADRNLPWDTVGDLHEALLECIPAADRPGKCATSMAFYRLRRALVQALEPDVAIGPRTRLRDLTTRSAKVLQSELSASLGLDFPAAQQGVVGDVGAVLILAAFCMVPGALIGALGAALARVHFTPAIGGTASIVIALIGIAMLYLDPRTFGSQTVGELARKLAAKNFHAFAEAGADRRPGAVWTALVEVLAAAQAVENPPPRITPDTRLLA